MSQSSGQTSTAAQHLHLLGKDSGNHHERAGSHEVANHERGSFEEIACVPNGGVRRLPHARRRSLQAAARPVPTPSMPRRWISDLRASRPGARSCHLKRQNPVAHDSAASAWWRSPGAHCHAGNGQGDQRGEQPGRRSLVGSQPGHGEPLAQGAQRAVGQRRNAPAGERPFRRDCTPEVREIGSCSTS
jgi:hypothetical protein